MVIYICVFKNLSFQLIVLKYRSIDKQTEELRRQIRKNTNTTEKMPRQRIMGGKGSQKDANQPTKEGKTLGSYSHKLSCRVGDGRE